MPHFGHISIIFGPFLMFIGIYATRRVPPYTLVLKICMPIMVIRNELNLAVVDTKLYIVLCVDQYKMKITGF